MADNSERIQTSLTSNKVTLEVTTAISVSLPEWNRMQAELLVLRQLINGSSAHLLVGKEHFEKACSTFINHGHCVYCGFSPEAHGLPGPTSADEQIERLRHKLEETQRQLTAEGSDLGACQVERDRLRAALDAIRAGKPHNGAAEPAVIADDALSGEPASAPETKERQGWRDVIVDNAPARTRVLTLRAGNMIAIAAWERVGSATGWHIGDGMTFLAKVTHWMPLPAPPSAENGCERSLR